MAKDKNEAKKSLDGEFFKIAFQKSEVEVIQIP